jgi:hypothetical protein
MPRPRATLQNGVQMGLDWTISGVALHFIIPPRGFPSSNTLTTQAVQTASGGVVTVTAHCQTPASGTWSDSSGEHGVFTAQPPQ